MIAAVTFMHVRRRMGQWLAFDSDRDGARGIYVAKANGQGIGA